MNTKKILKRSVKKTETCVEGKDFHLSLPEALLVLGEDLEERTRSCIIADIEKLEGLSFVRRENSCDAVFGTKNGNDPKFWPLFFKEVRKITQKQFAEQKKRGPAPDGIQCTGCDRFGQHNVAIAHNDKIRVVFCGSCHRTWFRPNEKYYQWFLAGKNETPLLRKKFEILEL